MVELNKQISDFNSSNTRNLRIEPMDGTQITKLEGTDSTPQINQQNQPIILVPVAKGRRMFLESVTGMLGAGGGAGAGIAGAGAGALMATMGAGKEKKEIQAKENDVKDSEFGLLMVMQNRHRALTKVEGEVWLFFFVNKR
jgi:hypothetical protein